MSCSFHVELVDAPPTDAPILSAEERQLLEISIIRRIFEKATAPNKNFPEARRRGGEFEQFSVDPDSTEELKEARNALGSLPTYDNPDYPPGVYVESEGVIAAVAEDCVT